MTIADPLSTSKSSGMDCFVKSCHVCRILSGPKNVRNVPLNARESRQMAFSARLLLRSSQSVCKPSCATFVQSMESAMLPLGSVAGCSVSGTLFQAPFPSIMSLHYERSTEKEEDDINVSGEVRILRISSLLYTSRTHGLPPSQSECCRLDSNDWPFAQVCSLRVVLTLDKVGCTTCTRIVGKL